MRKVTVILMISLFVYIAILIGKNNPTEIPFYHIPLHDASAEEFPQSLSEDLVYVRSNDKPELMISFSHEEFFYPETIFVELISNEPNAKIFYTTDSSIPTTESQIYSDPIEINAKENLKCVVIKAIAISGDGTKSPVTTHSYFVGLGVNERFSTYVFSLSTDHYNLYDYEYGILVAGKEYDDFMAENPNTELEMWQLPGNYFMRGREWERPVYVEVLTAEGNRILAQNAGIRVHGGASRSFTQKSLRLIARREYEPTAGKFQHNFFKGYLNAGFFPREITSYDTLILRNGGNENYNAMIRNPLASLISRKAGFTTVSPERGVAVFVNGEYYGYADLNVQINEQFLEDLYDAPQRAFDIIDGGFFSVDIEDEENYEIADAFDQILYYADQGFTEEAIQAAEAFFDIDNLLFYYAIQIYLTNDDWPYNNIKIWRYNGTPQDGYFAKELDGRWRYMLYDLDWVLGFDDAASPRSTKLSDFFHPLSSPLLRTILTRQEYAEIFSNYICDLANEHFSIDSINSTMQELNDINLEEWKEGLTFYGRRWESVLYLRESILNFARVRPHYILDELQEIFGYTDMFRIVSDGSCKINSLNGNEGRYFNENSVPITPILSRGQVVDYWLVGDEKRYGDELTVSINDASSDGVVSVSLVTRDEFPPLFFKDTYDTGSISGFTMYNPTDHVQNTIGLYLSDDLHNLKKWPFPSLNISPGSVWEFVGRNSTSTDVLLKIGLNFNPRKGELIFLSNQDGVVLDYIMMDTPPRKYQKNRRDFPRAS